MRTSMIAIALIGGSLILAGCSQDKATQLFNEHCDLAEAVHEDGTMSQSEAARESRRLRSEAREASDEDNNVYAEFAAKKNNEEC